MLLRDRGHTPAPRLGDTKAKADLGRGQSFTDRQRQKRQARGIGGLIERAVHDPVGLALGLPSPAQREHLRNIGPAERRIATNRAAGPPARYVNVKAAPEYTRHGTATRSGRPEPGAVAYDAHTGQHVTGRTDPATGAFKPDRPTFLSKLAASGNRALVDLIDKAKRQIDEHGIPIVSTGGGPTLSLPGATAHPVTGLGTTVVRSKGLENAFKDALTIPQTAPTTIAETIRAALDLADGNTDRAAQLLAGFKGAATYKLLTGDVKGAEKAAKDHPLFTALEASGVEAVAGRALGAGARLGGSVSPGLRRVGSLERAPLQVFKDITVGRHYDRDLLKKGLQVFTDRGHARANVKAGRHPQQLTGTRLDRELRRDARETNDLNIERIKQGRRAEQRTSEKSVPKKNPVAALIAEGRVTPANFRADLERIAARLDSEAAKLADRPNKLEANRLQAAAIRSALADKKLMADPHATAAKLADYVDRNNTLDVESAALSYIDPHRQRTAALVPAAIEHIPGAAYDPVPRPTASHVAKQQAKEVRDSAEQTLTQAKVADSREKSLLDQALGSAKASELRHGGVEPHIADVLLRALGRRDSTKAALSVARADATAARTAHIAAKDAAKGRPTSFVPGIVDAAGQRIPNATVEDLLRNAGVGDVSYLSQRPFVSDAGKHYMGSGSKSEDRPQAATTARTGKAVTEGAYDISRQAVVDEPVRKRVAIETTKAVNRTTNRYALGEFKTPTLAREAADAMRREGGPEMVVVSKLPGILSTKAARAGVERHVDTQGIEEQLSRYGLDIASTIIHDDHAPHLPGPYALVPKAVADTFRDFEKLVGTGDTAKAWEALTGNFRQVVLATSTRWVFGNVAEAELRGASEGITPLHVELGRRVANALEHVDPALGPEAYSDLLVSVLTGGPASMGQRFARRRSADQFSEHSLAGMAARTFDAALSTPGPAQIRDAWGAYKATIFAANHLFERKLEYGAIGKMALRELGPLTKDWANALRLSDGAIQDVARGLLDTEKQRQYARYIDDVRGRYSKLSPGMKRAVFYYAPFALWYVNALKFCLVTMPRHRPVQTGLLAAYNNAHQELIDAQAALPAFMRGSVANDGSGVLGKLLPKGNLPLQRYLPFGALSSDPFAMPAGQLLPQLGFLDNWAGIDFANRQLTIDGQPATEGDRLMIGLYSLADTMVPFAIPFQRIMQKGGTAQPTAGDPFAVKPGTEKSLLEGVKKTLNPLYPYGGGSSAPAAPTDRRGQILQRRSERIASSPGSARRAAILQRRAERIANGGG